MKRIMSSSGVFFLFVLVQFIQCQEDTTTNKNTTTTKFNECILNNPCPTLLDPNQSRKYAEGPCEQQFCFCYQGYGYLRECAEGHFFNEEIQKCKYPWHIPGCQPTTTELTTTNTEMTTTTTVTTTE